MKMWRFTLAIAFAFAFISCSRENETLIASEALVPLKASSEKLPVYVNEWEKPTWSLKDSSDYRISYYDRSIPQLNGEVLSSGAVLTWVKNIPSADGRVITKPLLLPFHVLPEGVHPAYDEKWYFTPFDGKIQLEFRTNKYIYVPTAPVLATSDVQFRYFVVPAETLDQLGLTKMSILQLPYDRLVSVLGVGK